MSDEDNFYVKIVALDEIYNSLVLSFFRLKKLKGSKKNYVKFQYQNDRVLALVTL